MSEPQTITIDRDELDKLLGNVGTATLKNAEKEMVQIGIQAANKRAWLLLGLGFAGGLNAGAIIVLLLLRHFGVL